MYAKKGSLAACCACGKERVVFFLPRSAGLSLSRRVLYRGVYGESPSSAALISACAARDGPARERMWGAWLYTRRPARSAHIYAEISSCARERVPSRFTQQANVTHDNSKTFLYIHTSTALRKHSHGELSLLYIIINFTLYNSHLITSKKLISVVYSSSTNSKRSNSKISFSQMDVHIEMPDIIITYYFYYHFDRSVRMCYYCSFYYLLSSLMVRTASLYN